MVDIVYHAAFLLLVVGTDAFFGVLSVLNLRHGERAVATRRDWIDERLDVDDVDELLSYRRTKTGLSVLQSTVSLVVLLLVLYSGLFADAVAAVDGLALGPTVEGVVLFAGTVLAVRLFGAPFSAVDTFVVEEVYGFNNQSPTLWLRDFVVGTVIAVVLVAAVGGAVLLAVAELPELWWAAAIGLYAVFAVVMQVLLPRVVMPLFYDFEPIEDGELRTGIEDVFDRAGFSCEQLYEMNASSRSSHSNAFFAGFGRAKRVVLFDTLVEEMELPQIQSVLAHELAHWKKAHIWKRLAAGTLQVGVTVVALWWLTRQPWLYELFGVADGAALESVPAAGLVVGGLFVAPINRLTAPLSNALSLKHEREADAFAVEVMGEGESMVGALSRLASENYSNPFPHPLYERFHYDHPPIPERMRYIEALAEDATAADAGGDPDGVAGD